MLLINDKINVMIEYIVFISYNVNIQLMKFRNKKCNRLRQFSIRSYKKKTNWKNKKVDLNILKHILEIPGGTIYKRMS